MLEKPAHSEWTVPEDAVFERAEVLGHDSLVKPGSVEAMRLEGDGAKGDIVEYIHLDQNDGKLHHEMKQDVEPYLKRVHDLIGDRGIDAGKNQAKDMYLAASVAPVVIYAWLNKHGLTIKDFKHDVIDKFLNDPENEPFRVWKGRV